jgi:hypothetical protein
MSAVSWASVFDKAPLASLARPPAHHLQSGGFLFALHRAALHNLIKAALQQAVDDDILMRNPAGPIKHPKAAPKKDKYLETPVVRKLLQEANRYQKDLFQ